MAGLLDLLNEIMRAKGPRQQNVPEGYGSLLSQFDAHANALNDAGAQQLQKQGLLGMNASDAFHAVANPDAVLNSNVANAAMGFSPLGMAGVMTYHGTPHKFEKFDLNKIGTGEGAQSYGHGIYLAESKNVAKSYQNTLGKTEITVDGKAISPSSFPIGDPRRGAAHWVDYAQYNGSNNPIVDALYYMKAGKTYPGMNEEAGYLKLWAEKRAKVSKGALYKQDLPDEVLPKMLQWDKPMSEQPDNVRKAFNDWVAPYLSTRPVGPGLTDVNIGGGAIGAYPTENVPEVLADISKHVPTKGSDFWQSIGGDSYGRNVPDQQTRAQMLKQMGIPGLSYFDAVSRTSAKGTKNHVIWDQGLLDRMKPSLVE